MLTMKKLGIAILLLTAPTGLRAQQNHAVAAISSPIATPTAVASNSGDDRPGLQKRNPRYQVQRDDILIISFALSPELNQTVTVQPDGYITLLSAGSLYVQGMTVPEVTAALKQTYSKTLRDPIIDVDLKDFQKPYFVALGQVGKPGQYDLRYDMTVTEAIGVAGGFNTTARTQVFLYHRVSDQWVEVKQLNIKQILQGKNVNEDAHVAPGDMIFVPEKWITKFRKYVPYGFGTGVSLANSAF
jgi:protein involved in polysaccharide export with SLBB domain